MNTPVIKGGLIVPKDDVRDFSRAAFFGALSNEQIPVFDFDVATPLEIKDQIDSDFCTNAALIAVSEPQEGVPLSYEYGFALTKHVAKQDPASWGADPKDAMVAAINVGSIAKADAPFNLQQNGRDFCAKFENWPAELQQSAGEHRKKAFFKVDGHKELFDSIRDALWRNRPQKRLVYTGIYWMPGWLESAGGIIKGPLPNDVEGTPHAFAFIGQKTVNGILHLKAQLSSGDKVGDHGFFYFPREIANKCVFAYTLEDADPDDVKAATWGFRAKIKDFLVKKFPCLNK